MCYIFSTGYTRGLNRTGSAIYFQYSLLGYKEQETRQALEKEVMSRVLPVSSLGYRGADGFILRRFNPQKVEV